MWFAKIVFLISFERKKIHMIKMSEICIKKKKKEAQLNFWLRRD